MTVNEKDLEYIELVKQGICTIFTMDEREGDVKIHWNPKVKDEVEFARKSVNEKLLQGWSAFMLLGTAPITERKGSQIWSFEPWLGRILLIPPMAAG